MLVTLQHACARLIREGVDLALREGRPVKVLPLVNPDAAPVGEPAINAQALDYLYALSGEAGAEMCVMTSNVPVTAIANYAADCGARHVIMGGGGQACGIACMVGGLAPLLLFSLIIFADAARRERSIGVGLLAVAAAFVQLTGYGTGFLRAWWQRCVLGRGEFEAFRKNFYK